MALFKRVIATVLRSVRSTDCNTIATTFIQLQQQKQANAKSKEPPRRPPVNEVGMLQMQQSSHLLFSLKRLFNVNFI